MGYLDSAGLAHLWGKVKTALTGKQDILTAGDGITIQDDTISTTTPVKGMTQAEYDALSEEEKMSGNLYVTPQSDYFPHDRNGAVPTGAIISFLGLTTPNGYLICDGAQYEIVKYARLALFIQEQFGTKNYFGGDGTTTFAVPDMRNLFLRGYHGEAKEQLSGEIGVKQEATKIPMVFPTKNTTYNNMIGYVSDKPKNIFTENEDSITELNDNYGRVCFNGIYNNANASLGTTKEFGEHYTSRPVNMAVVYCIKT